MLRLGPNCYDYSEQLVAGCLLLGMDAIISTTCGPLRPWLDSSESDRCCHWDLDPREVGGIPNMRSEGWIFHEDTYESYERYFGGKLPNKKKEAESLEKPLSFAASNLEGIFFSDHQRPSLAIFVKQSFFESCRSWLGLILFISPLPGVMMGDDPIRLCNIFQRGLKLPTRHVFFLFGRKMLRWSVTRGLKGWFDRKGWFDIWAGLSPARQWHSDQKHHKSRSFSYWWQMVPFNYWLLYRCEGGDNLM